LWGSCCGGIGEEQLDPGGRVYLPCCSAGNQMGDDRHAQERTRRPRSTNKSAAGRPAPRGGKQVPGPLFTIPSAVFNATPNSGQKRRRRTSEQPDATPAQREAPPPVTRPSVGHKQPRFRAREVGHSEDDNEQPPAKRPRAQKSLQAVAAVAPVMQECEGEGSYYSYDDEEGEYGAGNYDEPRQHVSSYSSFHPSYYCASLFITSPIPGRVPRPRQ
jgi:hypothetical protein